MFREIRDHIINIVTSRLTVLMILFAFFAGVLLYRCFNLQIVNGEEYLNDFILQIEKTRDISSTRGRILDRNGNVLAENELAYSVKIEDVFESSRNKNAKVNDVVYRLIKLIEKNGDSVITDFKIIIDEDGDYAYSVDGTALLRFQADVLGYRTIDELSEEEKAMTAQELIEYLSRAKGFAIGQYEDPENTKTPFVPGNQRGVAADGNHPVCHESDLLPEICGNHCGYQCQCGDSGGDHGEFRPAGRCVHRRGYGAPLHRQQIFRPCAGIYRQNLFR